MVKPVRLPQIFTQILTTHRKSQKLNYKQDKYKDIHTQTQNAQYFFKSVYLKKRNKQSYWNKQKQANKKKQTELIYTNWYLKNFSSDYYRLHTLFSSATKFLR